MRNHSFLQCSTSSKVSKKEFEVSLDHAFRFFEAAKKRKKTQNKNKASKTTTTTKNSVEGQNVDQRFRLHTEVDYNRIWNTNVGTHYGTCSGDNTLRVYRIGRMLRGQNASWCTRNELTHKIAKKKKRKKKKTEGAWVQGSMTRFYWFLLICSSRYS